MDVTCNSISLWRTQENQNSNNNSKELRAQRRVLLRILIRIVKKEVDLNAAPFICFILQPLYTNLDQSCE